MNRRFYNTAMKMAASTSALGRVADLVLEVRVEDEGGPLGLAPRTSFLAQALALAALSVALQAARGLSREEYVRRHRAGTLGRRGRGEGGR